MSLAGCASTATAPAPEPRVVVQTVTLPPDPPPGDLLVCPAAVRGLPTTGEALIPEDWRAAITRMAASRAGLKNQIIRLLSWHGVTCEEN